MRVLSKIFCVMVPPSYWGLVLLRDQNCDKGGTFIRSVPPISASTQAVQRRLAPSIRDRDQGAWSWLVTSINSPLKSLGATGAHHLRISFLLENPPASASYCEIWIQLQNPKPPPPCFSSDMLDGSDPHSLVSVSLMLTILGYIEMKVAHYYYSLFIITLSLCSW